MKIINYWTAVLSIVGKGCILVASVFVLMPSPVKAECAQWDVSGQWSLTQGKTVVSLNLQQQGTVITGTAGFKDRSVNYFTTTGSVDGTIKGNKFTVQIYWQKQSDPRNPKSATSAGVGVYTGDVGPQGRIEGTTYDKQKPSARAGWFSNVPMKCGQAR